MDAFNERERAFENQFKHDQEVLFRIQVRRARLFGLWVAERLGLGPAEARDYSIRMVAAFVGRLADIRDKAAVDLQAAGRSADRHRIDREAHALLEEAKRQIVDASQPSPALPEAGAN